MSTTNQAGPIRDTVRRFVVESFLFGDERPIRDDESFLESGIIDSTGILELMDFLQQSYGIKIEDHELVPENLDSLAAVAGFVARKTG